MKKCMLILIGILFISLVSAVPIIQDITIGETLVSKDVVICANVSDNVSDIVLVRINLRVTEPLWNWGLLMYEEGDLYCKTLSPELMDAYVGKEINYYISARNALGELTTSYKDYFVYSAFSPVIINPIEDEDDDDDESSSHSKDYCEPNWKCGDWSACEIGVMNRDCYDANHCDYSYNKPNEITGCEIEENVFVEKSSDYVFILFGLLGIVLLGILIGLMARR